MEESYKRQLIEKEATIQSLNLAKRAVEELLELEQKKSTKYSQAFLQLKEVFDSRQAKLEELHKALESQNRVIAELRAQAARPSPSPAPSAEADALRRQLGEAARLLKEEQAQHLKAVEENQQLRKQLQEQSKVLSTFNDKVLKGMEDLNASKRALEEQGRLVEEERLMNVRLRKELQRVRQGGQSVDPLELSPLASSTPSRSPLSPSSPLSSTLPSPDSHAPDSSRATRNMTSPGIITNRINNKDHTRSFMVPKANSINRTKADTPVLLPAKSDSALPKINNWSRAEADQPGPETIRSEVEEGGVQPEGNEVSGEDGEELGVSTSSAAAKKEKALDKVENEMVMFSKNFLIQIKGGTLTKIIERCTNESAPENSFMDTFLLTYRTYISPSELMDQLFERYNSPIPEVPEDVDPFAYQEAKKIIRLRVGNLLKRWLSNHFHDFNENDELLKKLASYVEKTFSLNEKNLASTIIQLSSQKNQTEMTASTVYGAKPPAPIVPKSVIILDMDPTEISRQLCLFEQNLFKKIHPKECLNQAWNKVERAERAPHIIQMIEHFNKVGRWVVYEIINQANIANRVKVMKHFIKVAIKCREYNNFNGCQEIIAGFGSSAVYRLHKSWGKLNKNEKQLIAQFNAIKETMSNNKSYNRYRTELKHINPPCVPYLGVFLTDLTFIEEGNPDYLATVDGRNDIINFDKMRKVAAVIEKILIYQPVSYNFEKVNVIYEHLQNSLSEMDEKSAFDISRQLEPKE